MFDILQSDYRVHADFPHRGTINDVLSFGFSFIESQDHIVEHVVANPYMTKQIIKEIDEFVLDPETESIGKIWTADLIVSNKLSDQRIVFSNNGHTAVLFLSVDPNKMEVRNA